MSNCLRIVDVMGELLRATGEEPVAAAALLSEEQAAPPRRAQKRAGAPAPAPKPEAAVKPRGTRRKATHYLRPDIDRRLGAARSSLRLLFPGPCRHLVSKSEIVNQALLVLLADFEKRGRASVLARRMAARVRTARGGS